MGLFTKEEKLYIDKKTGRSEWVTIKKGLPKLRKEKTGFEKAVADFQKAEKAKVRSARKAKIKKIGAKIDKARTSAGKHINPDILSPGGGLDLDIGSFGTKKPKKVSVKKPKAKYIVRNGKAYKVARPVQHKKKKSKTKKDDWDLDPFDFGGF